MSEEKELQESDFPEMRADDISDMVDFADLSELENVNNMDAFGELGDISDLGDMPDLSADVTLGDTPLGDEEEASDVSIDDMLGAMDMDEEPADLPDLTAPEMPEESLVGGLETGDESVELPDLTAEEPSEESLAPADEEPVELPDLTLDDMPEGLDIGGDAGDMPDLPLGDASELDMGTDAEGMSDLSMDDMPDEDILGGLDMEGLSEETPDISMDDMPGEDAGGDDISSVLPQTDGDMSDIALDDVTITEDGLLGDLDINLDALGETGDSEPAADEGLGNMLDGLLDDLDMNGSLDGEASPEGVDSQDDVADMLGLDDAFFEGDDSDIPVEEDASLDMLDASDMVPDAAPETAEKKPGFFKRVFGNVVTDEIAEQEREAAKKAQEEAEQQAEEDAKAKEEKEAQAAEKKAAKEAKAAEKKKQKEAKKAEKAQQKAEKKAKEEEEAAAELEIVGKLNKVGVCIIVIATIIFLAVEITGTNLFSYASTKKEAVRYFEMGKYTEAYQEAVGTKMKDKDAEQYQKIKTVMKVQQCLNAYQNYDRMKYYPEALDALLRGVKRYDANIEEATQLEVEKDMMSCRTQIISLLQSEFNMTESKAYSLLAMDKEAYQNEVVKIGAEKAR